MTPATATPTILLVDDEPDILHLLRRIMSILTTRYTILSCTDGDAALEQSRVQIPRLIITDYNLPGMNGLQLTAAIKAHTPATQVVFMSAYVTADMERRARERGADYIVRKPFQVDSLIEIVQTALA